MTTTAAGVGPVRAAEQPSRRSRPQGKEPVGRERILDAAARLFVEHGYAATTTRSISTAVGIKQPSLYYHFPNKEAMLVELLVATAEPSLMAARALLADAARPAVERLLELVRLDAHLLASGSSNVGSLYLLPETASPQCAPFREMRAELLGIYESLTCAAIADGDADAVAGTRTAALVFSLVEGVILRRGDEPGLDPDVVAQDIARAAARVLGVR